MLELNQVLDTKGRKTMSKYYLTEQSVKEEVKETHKLIPRKDTFGRTVSYECMILMPFGSRQKWHRVFSEPRRETAQARFQAIVRKVIHNRMIASVSEGWTD